MNYAGFWPRLLAHNIDLLPILVLSYLISPLIQSPNHDYLILGLVYFIYQIVFELSPMKATPGKRLAHLHAESTKKTSFPILAIVGRNLGKIPSLILFFGGFILIFFDPRRRGLHDYIGGTVVLFDED